jgi:hypothetical protein
MLFIMTIQWEYHKYHIVKIRLCFKFIAFINTRVLKVKELKMNVYFL